MKRLLTLLILFWTCFILCGCGETYYEEDASLEGLWVKGSSYWELNEDGTCKVGEGSRFSDCTYRYDDEYIYRTDYYLTDKEKSYPYKLKGNKLYITDMYGTVTEYKRK